MAAGTTLIAVYLQEVTASESQAIFYILVSHNGITLRQILRF